MDLHNNAKLQPTKEEVAEVLQIYEEEASVHVAEKVSGSEESGNGKGRLNWKLETLEALAEKFPILAEIVQGKGVLKPYFVEALLGETIDLLSTGQQSMDFHYVVMAERAELLLYLK